MRQHDIQMTGSVDVLPPSTYPETSGVLQCRSYLEHISTVQLAHPNVRSRIRHDSLFVYIDRVGPCTRTQASCVIPKFTITAEAKVCTQTYAIRSHLAPRARVGRMKTKTRSRSPDFHASQATAVGDVEKFAVFVGGHKYGLPIEGRQHMEF